MTKKKSIVIITILTILIILGGVFAFVSLDQGQLGTYDYTAYPKAIKLGLDLKGGVFAVFEATDKNSDDLSERIDGTVASLQKLLYDKGYTEAVVSRQGDKRIRVEVPDVENPEQVFNLIGRPASLEFKGADSDKVLLTGKDLEKAFVTQDDNGQYAIGLKFNKDGTKKFADATQANLNKTLAIYINGEKVMEPTVNAQITDGNAIISGSYTYQQAYDYAVSIQSGAFDVTLQVIETRTIGPALGANALKSSLLAGVIGLAFVFVFMILMYRMFGFAASIALIMYTMALLFFFAVFPWVQLTLPGIAGVIISLGMAVDANIIIFERIKDEYRMGHKSLDTSVKDGFRKATSAILDGNVTTIIAAIVIWIFGAATIKGFAITLLIGIVLSLLTSLLLTRLIILCIMSFSPTDGRLHATEKLYNVHHLYEAEEVTDEN